MTPALKTELATASGAYTDPNDPPPPMWRPRAAGAPFIPEPPPERVAWQERADARFAAYLATPEAAAVIQKRAEVNAKMRAIQLRNRANEIELPNELGLRTVALDDSAGGSAITSLLAALEWRATRSTPAIGSQPIIVMLGGPPGTGKSCAAAWVILRAKGDARYATAAEIVATPRNGWSANEEKWEQWLSIDLLAIDELGGEKGDPGQLVYLLSDRFNRGRATILTGNLKRNDFATRYKDERLIDRLVNGQGHGGAETGLPWYVAVTGESLRNPANVRAAS